MDPKYKCKVVKLTSQMSSMTSLGKTKKMERTMRKTTLMSKIMMKTKKIPMTNMIQSRASSIGKQEGIIYSKFIFGKDNKMQCHSQVNHFTLIQIRLN